MRRNFYLFYVLGYYNGDVFFDDVKLIFDLFFIIDVIELVGLDDFYYFFGVIKEV